MGLPLEIYRVGSGCLCFEGTMIYIDDQFIIDGTGFDKRLPVFIVTLKI